MRAWLLPVVMALACGGGIGSEGELPSDQLSRVRPPAVSGAFYPADSSLLAALVDSLLANATERDLNGDLITAVVPHAGYVYSAPVAAEVYGLLDGESYDLVFLLAPAHTVALRGFSAFSGDAYLTPLGQVPVAEEVSRRLINGHPAGSFEPAAHELEHAIEVQLPFLERALHPGYEIVPVLAGSMSIDEIMLLAELILAEAYDSKVLVLASSDLSHYPPLETACRVDSQTIDLYLSGDLEAFVSGTERMNMPLGVSTYTCGRFPMAVLMAYNALYPEAESALFRHATSADAGGGTSEVVGYAAMGTVTASSEPESWALGPEERQELLDLARKSVESAVTGGWEEPDAPGEGGLLATPRGAFVTLHQNGMLRGCIGYIRPVLPLYLTVHNVARSAALEDPRFAQVTESDLDEITYEISVLTPMQVVSDWQDVRVGTDGLYLIAEGHSGVLLPQVPIEMGWSLTEYMEGICRKAGLPADAYLEDVLLFRFQAEVFGSSDEHRE